MAPRRDLLTPLGLEMLDSLPPAVRDDPDYLAVIHCYARETERIDETIEGLRAEFNPVTATETGLTAFELLLRLPAGGDTVEGRRIRVRDRLASLFADASGVNWILRVSGRIGSSWSYEEHVPGDAGSPPAQTLRILLPFDATAPEWAEATRAVREETPSELDLIFVSTGGFRLDVSEMDSDGMGI